MNIERKYNSDDRISIEEYARKLMGLNLIESLDKDILKNNMSNKGKGKLGSLVEEKYFGYKINSRKEADFKEARIKSSSFKENN